MRHLLNIKVAKPHYQLRLRTFAAEDFVLSFRAMRNVITSNVRYDKMDVSGLVLWAWMAQVLHARPLSMDLLQSATSRTTLVPGFIIKIFRALFEYTTSEAVTYSCSFEGIDTFDKILQHIVSSKDEVSSDVFTSGLRDLGYSTQEIENIKRWTISALDRFSRASHPHVLITDIVSELARLRDWKYRDADQVRSYPLWRAIEPVQKIEAVRPLASRSLWREDSHVCAAVPQSFVSLLSYHLFVKETWFSALGKHKKVESVSPDSMIYELEPTNYYDYWFEYLNALLDIADIPPKSNGGPARGWGGTDQPSAHTTSSSSAGSGRSESASERGKTNLMIRRIVMDGVTQWVTKFGNLNLVFRDHTDLSDFFKLSRLAGV